MKIYREMNLNEFKLWSETQLNDFFWFDNDWIANFFGYVDFNEMWYERRYQR